MVEVRRGEVLGPETVSAKDEARVRRGFFPAMRRAARQIPFTHDLVAAYYCAIDPNTPMRVRGTLLGALLYFVTPIDAVVDFIPLIGFGDDAAVLVAAITMVANHISPRHREQAKDALSD